MQKRTTKYIKKKRKSSHLSKTGVEQAQTQCAEERSCSAVSREQGSAAFKVLLSEVKQSKTYSRLLCQQLSVKNTHVYSTLMHFHIFQEQNKQSRHFFLYFFWVHRLEMNVLLLFSFALVHEPTQHRCVHGVWVTNILRHYTLVWLSV